MCLILDTCVLHDDIQCTWPKKKEKSFLLGLQVSENSSVCGETLRGVEWVHGLFLFPLVLGKM